MRRGYDYSDGEFATAVAASAFAIHLHEEYQRKLRERSGIQMSRVKTRKDMPSRPEVSSSTRRPFGQDDIAPSFARVVPSTTKDQKHQGNSRKHRNAETKAGAWERAEMKKISKRYEKIQSDILAWGNEKKMRAKHELEKEKNELENRRDRNLQHYRIKVAKIDHTARGARVQVEQKRKYEESVLKQRAKTIRSARKAPVCCCCF